MQTQIHLRFRQGSADKVYNAFLEEVEGGWLVNFAYGRYGKPLRTGTKTAKPIPYSDAKSTYDKLVQSKLCKGYTASDSATPFTGSEKDGERTSWLPQLLNPIEPDDVDTTLIDWYQQTYMQIKHDGERRGIIFTKDEVIPANRKGLRVAIDPKVMAACNKLSDHLPSSWILDCEDMGDYLVVFDVIDTSRIRTFEERIVHLKTLASRVNLAKVNDQIKVDIPQQIYDAFDAAMYIEKAQQANEEGVVLRWGLSLYEPGRPNSGGTALKLKFYASCTCRVQSNHPTKRSIGLELFGNNWTPVGNCTIPPNYVIPNVGDLVEIKYLYAYRGGSIYQPQYKGVRTDLEAHAATLDQLKFKD